LLRPVTEREEWLNRARNPLPEYIAEAADILRARGFFVVLVADIDPDKEWLVGDLPASDMEILSGELGVVQLMALAQRADVVVGGSGWIVPAAIANRTPTVIVCGGQGAHNAPTKIVPPLDGGSLGWVIPDRYCMCADMLHPCRKEISRFTEKFTDALMSVTGVTVGTGV
jgi:ADP-heptose:LPS heptosyltransferase